MYGTIFVIAGLASTVLLVIVLLFLIQGPPFIPSSDPRTMALIKVVKTLPVQRIVDLGCGDGKLVISLAQQGYQVDGVELQPWLVWRARRRIRKLGLSDQAHIYWGNLWKFDTSGYDTVVLYVIKHIMPKLDQKLASELKPGSFVVSNYFEFPERKPTKKLGQVAVYKF